jgi:hypothetical protein
VIPGVAWWQPQVLEARTSYKKRVKHTTFKGQAAGSFLAEHARRHGRQAAFAKARASLEGRGFTDGQEVTLYEAFTDVAVEPTIIGWLLDKVAPVTHAQIYSRPEGYMTVWTWNDGDDATWEGMIEWIQFRSDGEVFAMASTQIDTTRTDESAVLWTDGIDAGATRPGGAPTCSVSYKGVDCRDYRRLPETISRQAWIGFLGREFPIFWGCRYTGTGYFPCVGWGTAGNLVWSGIQEITRYAHNCQCVLFGTNCPAGCGG